MKMGKIFKINESDVVNLVKNINEQIIGNNTNARQSKQNFGFTEKIDGSLFKNGIDVIDTNNSRFQRMAQVLKRVPKGYNVLITGGASNVGTSNGYDNNALANRRANNFIQALKQFGVDTSTYHVNTKVGVADIKDSPEANAEQYVKIEVTKPDVNYSAIDNTATQNPDVRPKNINLPQFKTIKVPATMFDKVIEILNKNGVRLK